MSKLPPLEGNADQPLDEISELKKKIQELQDLHTKNRIEIDSKKQILSKQEIQMKNLKKINKKLQKDIKKVKNPPRDSDDLTDIEENKKLKQAILDINEEIRIAKEKKSDTESQYNKVNVELQNIQNQFNGQNVPYEVPPEIAQKQQEIKNLENQRSRLQVQNFDLHNSDSLKTYQVSLDDQISALIQQHEEKESKVAELRQQLSEIQHKINEIKLLQEHPLGELSRFKSQLSDEEARTIQLKSALTRLSLLAQQCRERNLV